MSVRESGLFSEIARAVNRTSEKLKLQETALRRQEQARANWIAGVSHDIRTPLSMIMGYAGQLEESPLVPESMRGKVSVIREQKMCIRDRPIRCSRLRNLPGNEFHFPLDAPARGRESREPPEEYTCSLYTLKRILEIPGVVQP